MGSAELSFTPFLSFHCLGMAKFSAFAIRAFTCTSSDSILYIHVYIHVCRTCLCHVYTYKGKAQSIYDM